MRMHYLMTAVLFSQSLWGATYYVDGAIGDDANSGLTTATAKKTIQAAIDVAVDGDTVLVAPGRYTPISTKSKLIEIRATHGAKQTVIDGNRTAPCANLGARKSTTLEGFSLARGYLSDVGAAVKGGQVKNCIMRDCTGRAIVQDSYAVNCLAVENTVASYGVFMHVDAYNCTIVAQSGKNAAWDCSLYNCILVGGIYLSAGEPECCHSCRTDSRRSGDAGNVTGDPLFVDPENGDYRLSENSPCVDTGANVYVTGTIDLEENSRIVNARVDLGCYEYGIPPSGAGVIDEETKPQETKPQETWPEMEACTISFDANGDGTNPISLSRKVGQSYGDLPNIVRAGYVFEGWYTAANGGEHVWNTTLASGNVTLYAHWSRNSAPVFISNVEAHQRYPWNGLVDIVVTLQGAENDVAEAECYFVATNSATKAPLQVTHIRPNGGDTRSGTIWTRKFIWNAKADVGAVKIDDVTLTPDLVFDAVQLWEGGAYWAKCNVGASKPEEAGYYFWWGDTVGYTRSGGTWTSDYYYSGVTWVSSTGTRMSSSPFSSSSCPTYNKSTSTLQSQGYIDSTGNLVAKYDAATAHLGAPWRMPTSDEMRALVNNCTTTWTRHGRLVTGKGAYASKSIFLPAAGSGYDSRLDYPGSYGYYWSSTPSSDYSLDARYLFFDSGDFGRYRNYRYGGRSVRPLRGFAQ